MKSNRVTAYVLAGVAFVLSLLAYMNYVYMLGFPDGFITELGYAQRRLAYTFIVSSVVTGSCFIFLGTMAPQKKISIPLSVATALYSVVIVTVLLVDVYYRSSLVAGGG
jgi:hypothetical protein